MSQDSQLGGANNTSKALSQETRERIQAEVKDLDKELTYYETYKGFENEGDREKVLIEKMKALPNFGLLNGEKDAQALRNLKFGSGSKQGLSQSQNRFRSTLSHESKS